MNVVEALRLPGIEAALERVEESLSASTAGQDPFLAEVAVHLVRAGGKRLRPALVLASAAACGAAPEVPDEVISGAVAVELVHLGSLYHDDVMDEAASRRGVDSANARWGNLVAILAGDFLLARASEIAASLGTEVAALLARTIGQLCEGEVGQLRYAFDAGRTEKSYFASIAGKTASLMSTSARIGGLTSGAPRAQVEALTDYGYALGMTFQIWDDIRDLVSTDDDLGKPAGHDMVEGTYTLPVLRALAVPGIGEDLVSLLGAPLDPPARDKARDLVLSTSAIESSIATGRQWAERACAALEPLRRIGPGADHVTLLGDVGFRLLDELTVP
ncbi:MAG TPA: polyprenyl synthetase family protein [Acidimicrobiales bacterium]|nr:polyprenyl synthetase family protein [Acidimicrobiales bacterium]